MGISPVILRRTTDLRLPSLTREGHCRAFPPLANDVIRTHPTQPMPTPSDITRSMDRVPAVGAAR